MRRGVHLFAMLVLAGLGVVLFSSTVRAAAPSESLEVVIAIDTSGSMRPALNAAKQAANEFVASMPAEVGIGVDTFGSRVKVLTAPTTDRALLSQQINGIGAGGNTALYDAVVAASQQFTPSVEHKVLVVFSDGRDDGSKATLEEAVAAAQGLHVEAISLTTAETELTSLQALGPVTSADDVAGLSAAFARVAGLVAAVVVPPTVPVTAPPTTVATTTATPTTVVSASAPPASAAATPTTVATPPPTLPAPTASSNAHSFSLRLWLGAGAFFLALFALGLLLFPRERVSKARLGIDKPSGMSEMGKRAVSAVEGALERRGKRAELAMTLTVANISMKPADFVATVAVTAFVAGLVGLLIGGPLVGFAVALAICLAVRFYVRHTKAKQQRLFAEQLPDVLQQVMTALRSGFGLTQALDSVAEEAEEPARSQFGHVLVEARLGRDLSEAMRALAQRMDSDDLEWVVSAIDINRDTGGNLSEILNTVGETVRDRQRMARQVSTLTAEGRLSARILMVMPFLMALLQWRVNPNSFDLLTHGGGLAALILAGVLMFLGTVWVRKIVNSLSS